MSGLDSVSAWTWHCGRELAWHGMGSMGPAATPPLQMQKPEGWAALGLGWELAAASLDCSFRLDGLSPLKPGRDELLPPSEGELQGPIEKVGLDPPLTAVLIKALDISANSFS